MIEWKRLFLLAWSFAYDKTLSKNGWSVLRCSTVLIEIMQSGLNSDSLKWKLCVKIYSSLHPGHGSVLQSLSADAGLSSSLSLHRSGVQSDKQHQPSQNILQPGSGVRIKLKLSLTIFTVRPVHSLKRSVGLVFNIIPSLGLHPMIRSYFMSWEWQSSVLVKLNHQLLLIN